MDQNSSEKILFIGFNQDCGNNYCMLDNLDLTIIITYIHFFSDAKQKNALHAALKAAIVYTTQNL